MIPAVIIILIGLGLKKCLFFKIEVPTNSMFPAIHPGDQLLAVRVKSTERLKRGDIVVFRSAEDLTGPGRDKLLIKRLIGLPFDQVELNNGAVFINGVKLDEAYVASRDEYGNSFRVPEGEFLFLGDNRPASFDSRFWLDPYVLKQDILARAIFRIAPLKSMGFIK